MHLKAHGIFFGSYKLYFEFHLFLFFCLFGWFFLCFLTSEGHKSMSYSILTVLIPGGTLWFQMKEYGIYFSWIVASGWMVLISTLSFNGKEDVKRSWQK